jgi:hypothetical protein
MMIQWPNISPETVRITEYINYVFTGVFITEAMIKLIAFRKRYFAEIWNRFDFSIVVSSIVFTVAQTMTTFPLTSTAQVIRTLRIGRMFKLFSWLKQLQIIFQTFLNTLSSLINVGSLMFLIIYIYAVIGISFFAEVKVKSPMNEKINFQSIGNALITLTTVATGDNWNNLMDAISRGKELHNDCVDNPTYADFMKEGEAVGCGNYGITYAFFLSFVVMISLVFLNLFIAIILDGYFEIKN